MFPHSVCYSVQGLILLSEFEVLIKAGEKEFPGIQKSFEEQHNMNSSHVHALSWAAIGLMIAVSPKCALALITCYTGTYDTFN